jgi:hypothetical protein
MYTFTYSTSSVASHDTLPSSAQSVPVLQASPSAPDIVLSSSMAKVAKPARLLVALENECKNWEATDLAATHARLYQLLTRAYSYYITMKRDGDKEVRADYKKALEIFIAERGYKFLADSDDMHRVVKAVFGSDRRRVSAYSKALKVAMTSGAPDADGKPSHVPVAELASWITAQGGVEEVRRGTNSAQNSSVPKHEIVTAYLEDIELMKFVPDATTMPMSVEDNDKPVLLIAVYRPNGEFEIKGTVKSETVIKAAYDAFYKEHKERIEAANKIAADSKADAIASQLAKLAA